MFSDIHHISYLVPDLDAAIQSYARMFGASVTGRGHVPNLGEVAFLQAGNVEIEFIRPNDTNALAADARPAANQPPAVHHIAYAVPDLDRVVAQHRARGYRFLTETPFTNFMGYRLIYFDPADTNGARIHLTDAATLRPNP